MRSLFAFVALAVASQSAAQTTSDQAGIRKIVRDARGTQFEIGVGKSKGRVGAHNMAAYAAGLCPKARGDSCQEDRESDGGVNREVEERQNPPGGE